MSSDPLVASGFILSFTFPVVAIALAILFKSYNDAIGRNPSASDALSKNILIFAALIESLAILGFTFAILITTK